MSEERVELDPHPIRDRVAHLLKDGDGKGEPAVIEDEGVKELETLVDEYVNAKTHELHDVVRTLWAITDWLEGEQKSPKTARKIIEVFKREHVIERIMKIEEEMRANEAEKATESGGKFTDFAGGEKKTAPKVGQKAPKGSLKLGSLNFPKKL